jgi:hypothetical protein
MLLLLPLDVASELLFDELEAELRHCGDILDRHAGPIGPVAADGHAELLGGPLGVGTEPAISTSVTRHRCPVLSPFRRAITAPPSCRAAPCIRRCAVIGRRRRCALMGGCLGCRVLSVAR